MRLSIFRFDPDKDEKPYMQDYEIELEAADQMLLDVMVRLKARDDTLTFRKSCREGVCGSDRSIMNCTEVCPKGLSPSRAIEKIRLMMVGESL